MIVQETLIPKLFRFITCYFLIIIIQDLDDSSNLLDATKIPRPKVVVYGQANQRYTRFRARPWIFFGSIRNYDIQEIANVYLLIIISDCGFIIQAVTK